MVDELKLRKSSLAIEEKAITMRRDALQEQLDHRNAWEIDSQLEQAMDALRCPPGDADVSVLSGGEKRRVALCKLLLEAPDLLLLDEPTNDLDVDTLRALEEAIQNYAGCVVVTSHDRWFLDRLATHILAFEGKGYVHWCEGNFDTYERNLRERMGDDPDDDSATRRAKYKSIHAG